MQFADLFSQHDLLDGLDTEPIVDYLQKHGVFTNETAGAILSVENQRERNVRLLRAIDEKGCPQQQPKPEYQAPSCSPSPVDDLTSAAAPLSGSGGGMGPLNAYALFINALRHTGYHRLASLLDNDRRIIPSHPESRGYHCDYQERLRHRGQVAIVIQVSAVKVSATRYGLDPLPQHQQNSNSSGAVTDRTLDGSGGACWIGITELPSPICSGRSEHLDQLAPENGNGLVATVALTADNANRERKKMPALYSCFCFRRRKRHRQRHRPRLDAQEKVVELTDLGAVVDGGGDRTRNGGNRSGAELEDEGRREQQQVGVKAGILNSKSDELYRVLRDPTSPEHERLLKYFEQDCDVLVLDCCLQEALLVVSIICTRLARLEALVGAHQCGQLTADLERLLLSPDLLRGLGVRQMRLAVAVDEVEVGQARADLMAAGS